MDDLLEEYRTLLARHQLDPQDLDYSRLDYHRPLLDRLAEVNHTAVTVFDMHSRTHVYASHTFASLFGHDMADYPRRGNDWFDERIHPEDFPELLRNSIRMLHYFYALPHAERTDYKLINEYRLRGHEGRWIRVVEQHQALELDKLGRIWLTLGIADISPNQQEGGGVVSQLFNYRKGGLIPVFTDDKVRTGSQPLTAREKEILGLVRDGLPSKLISDRLSISVHTVNTHRQRILEKLQASNTAEAVAYAGSLGLV